MEGYEMTTLADFEKLLEAEKTARLQKDLAAGCYSHLTKQDFHEVIEAFAADIQSPGETPQQAYVRVIEKTDHGRALYKAYKSASYRSPAAASVASS
jgi:hypothetical protein